MGIAVAAIHSTMVDTGHISIDPNLARTILCYFILSPVQVQRKENYCHTTTMRHPHGQCAPTHIYTQSDKYQGAGTKDNPYWNAFRAMAFSNIIFPKP